MSEADKYDFDGSLDLSEADKYDFDGSLDLSEADKYDFSGDLDFSEMEKNDEEKNDDQNEESNKEDYIENFESLSTSTVLTSEREEIEGEMKLQDKEEEIEIRPEELDDTELAENTDEIDFIKEVEELAKYAREIRGENESIEPQIEKEYAAYYAEQYYESLKEKEVLNEQNSKEEQETEELMQEVAEELKGDQESGYKRDELEKEDISEASKEITSTEEFEYLWEVRDKLDREGKPLEEIEEVMHEAEEMYKTIRNAERLYEEQQQEKLKLVDHEDEATEEDLKEELDRADLVEQAVELEQNMVQQGESQEEIDNRIEEAIETTKFGESLEKIIEKQELEKLKLVDHEDEATEEDQKEVLDRTDLVEQAVELEEKLVQQGQSQEEIDNRVEEAIETTKFGESLEKINELEQESIVNEKPKKQELEINEQNSSENVENEENLEVLKPELDAMESESDEEEEERLQELYRRETGKRSIYARQKTKGYNKWLEQRELEAEKLKNSKSDSEKIKEVKEEDWKTTLKQWIKDASEEEYNAEFKSELKKALESYDEFDDLTRKFLELYDKSQRKKLSEKEKNRIKSLMRRLQELDPIQLELLKSVFFIKKHIAEQYCNDFWNWPLVNRVLSKFFKYISQKWKNLKKAQENKEKSKEIIKKTIEQASEGEINPELKKKLEEIDSEDKKDLLEKITKLGTEESDKEDWKKTLKQWIKDASEEECNAELKSELKKALENYDEFEVLTRKFLELYEKSQYEKLSEKEENRIKSLMGRLQELSPIQLELLANIRAFKDYINNQYWYDFWNKPLVNRMLSKFFKHISEKYKFLKQEMLKLKKLIITKYGNNYRISHRYMLNLSKYIYLKISYKGIFNLDDLINNVFNKLKTDIKSKFVEEKDIQEYITNYIRDLIIIVKNFKDRMNNNESDLINISLFAKSLLNNGISLNNKIDRLRQNLREIFLYLKKAIPEFKLEKIDKTDLKFDLRGKICGKCGLYQPYSQFHPRTDGGYKSVCKVCYLEKTQISLYKKEYRLIQEIKNGHFKGKCANPECDIDFTKLPAIEIHHPNSKRFTWRLVLKERYDLIKKKLDEIDKAIPLCRNCHSLTHKVFYSHYKDLINDRYIFVNESDNPRSAEEIDKEIKKRIERYGLINNYNYSETKIKILGWLRKRSVINQLYNGKCANCGERDIGKLQFHHMDPTLKNTFKHRNPNFDHLNIWKTFILSNIKEAADRVIYEECICLCGNCHALITSKYFEKNSVEILNTEFFLNKNERKTKFHLNGESFSENIINFFNRLRNVCERGHQIIRSIKKNNDIQIKDQLRTRPRWQLTLLYIYFLVNYGKKNIFSIKEFEHISGFSHSKTLHWVKYLFENNYLVIVNETSKGERTYSINKRGMDEALRIIHDNKLTYEEGFLSFVKNLNYPNFS